MKDFVEYLLFKFFFRLARTLSYRSASLVGSALGGFVFRRTKFRKSITLDNLRRAFPEKPPVEIEAIAQEAYRNYGIALMQMLWSWGATSEDLVSKAVLVDNGAIQRALALRRGLILLSGHFGAWELFATSFRLLVGEPFVLVVQTQRNRRIDEMLSQLRSRFGNSVVTMGIGTRALLRAVAEKRIIGMLGDQSSSKEGGVFVKFFGRPAATHRGAAALALKHRVPVIMAVLVRQPDDTYRILCEELEYSDIAGNSEDAIRELTSRHVAVLERYIRQYPGQWLWMHKRWKHAEYYRQHRNELEKAYQSGTGA